MLARYNLRERLRGNRNTGNKTDSLWEGNLPPRGSLRGPLENLCKPLKTSLSEVLSETLSEADFPFMLPLIVLPLNLSPKPSVPRTHGRRPGETAIFCHFGPPNSQSLAVKEFWFKTCGI